MQFYYAKIRSSNREFSRVFSLFLQLIITGLLLSLISSCTPKTVNIDVDNDQAGAVMGLDYRDFQKAAGEVISKLLQSDALKVKADGGRYVLAISRIVNDTMQRIDTDQLIKKIRVELLNSGRVYVTTAVGLYGAEDELSMNTRQLRQSEEFNQQTIAKKGQMIAPDMSLSGKIMQKNIKLDKNVQQIEYYFQLSLTNVHTGLAIWEGEEFIGKRGSNKSVSW